MNYSELPPLPSDRSLLDVHAKHLFKFAVKIDGQEEPVEIECAYVSFCYEIKLEPSGP